MGKRLTQALDELSRASDWLVDALKTDRDTALAGATPYLRLFGLASGAGFLAQGALASSKADGAGAKNRILLARFFAENLLPEAGALRRAITSGADGLLGYRFN